MSQEDIADLRTQIMNVRRAIEEESKKTVEIIRKTLPFPMVYALWILIFQIQ